MVSETPPTLTEEEKKLLKSPEAATMMALYDYLTILVTGVARLPLPPPPQEKK